MFSKGYFLFLAVLTLLGSCQHDGSKTIGLTDRNTLQIKVDHVELITKMIPGRDGIETPYLRIQLNISNRSGRKLLYTCKASSADLNNQSRMFIVQANNKVPQIISINAFGADLIKPHQTIKINAVLKHDELALLLNHEENFENLKDERLLSRVISNLKNSFLLYIMDPNDCPKYKHFFGQDTFMFSDTINVNLFNVPVKISGK